MNHYSGTPLEEEVLKQLPSEIRAYIIKLVKDSFKKEVHQCILKIPKAFWCVEGGIPMRMPMYQLLPFIDDEFEYKKAPKHIAPVFSVRCLDYWAFSSSYNYEMFKSDELNIPWYQKEYLINKGYDL